MMVIYEFMYQISNFTHKSESHFTVNHDDTFFLSLANIQLFCIYLTINTLFIKYF